MLTKGKCLNALDYLFDNALDNDYMSVLDSKMYDILEQLIEEHFDNSNNSADFNHFKLHADSTLKTFKKDELIDYIHMLYYNWQGSDWAYNNVVKANFQLLDEINELKRNRKQSIDEKIY